MYLFENFGMTRRFQRLANFHNIELHIMWILDVKRWSAEVSLLPEISEIVHETGKPVRLIKFNLRLESEVTIFTAESSSMVNPKYQQYCVSNNEYFIYYESVKTRKYTWPVQNGVREQVQGNFSRSSR